MVSILTMDLSIELQDPKLITGFVSARGVLMQPSPEPLLAEIRALIERRAAEVFPPPALKEAVRALLKRGGFKASGRNKPASEYLAQAAREGRFPFINSVVDINNLLSLESGLPISVLDRRATGDRLTLRHGRPGEKYVFNSAGQEIELAGLICACRSTADGGVPLGNPVKDSMEGKLKPDTTDVVAVIYGTSDAHPRETLQRLVERFQALLKEYAGARETSGSVLP